MSQCAVLMACVKERYQEHVVVASSAGSGQETHKGPWADLALYITGSGVLADQCKSRGPFREGKSISYIIHAAASHCLLCARH